MKTFASIIKAVPGALAAVLVLAPCRAAASVDTVAAVTLSTTTGLSTAIVLDSRNTIHIAYWDPATQRVMYVTRTNGSAAWGTPVVVGDNTVDHSSPTAMALDSAGTPHIAYYDVTNGALRRARLSGTAWLSDTIDTFSSTEPFVSMAMGSDGNPRVLYNDSENARIKYGFATGTVWSTFTVVNGSSMAARGDITLDSADRAHMAFNAVVSPLHILVYAAESAARTGGGTVLPFEVPGTTDTAPGNVSIAVDASNNAHISAFDEDDGDLWYFTGDTTALVISTAATTGVSGHASAIALSVSGRPKIAYREEGAGLILIECNLSVCDDPGDWTPTPLDPDPDAGEGLDLVRNMFGSAFTSYYTGGFIQELRFATNANRGLSISGTVLDGSAVGLPGVTLTLTGNIVTASTVTGAPGTYAFTELLEGNYGVTPSFPSFGFQPATIGLSLQASAAGQDFVGGPVSFTTVDNLFDPTQGESVTLDYEVLDGHVTIAVYALNGRLVKTLVDEDTVLGSYTTLWDGRNVDGDIVASGVYFVRAQADQLKGLEKVVVIK